MSPVGSPTTWRSLDELANARGFREMLRNEFPAGAAWLDETESDATGMRRRNFMKLMGASFALAGLTGCGRQKPEKIVPYVVQPEDVLPGVPKFYATAFSYRGHARGVLVESHLGRPTKIEGNPDHPASLGATDAATQASVLDLYDPDRMRSVTHNGTVTTWDDFENAYLQRKLQSIDGKGHAILIEPTSSPTLQRLLSEVLRDMPATKVYQHAALPSFPPGPRHDFSKPDLILAVDDDFLGNHPDCLRHTREFASRRRTGAKSQRLYVIEPTPTLTGAKADHRIAVKPSRIADLRRALAGGTVKLDEREVRFIENLCDDLEKFRGRTLVLGAPELESMPVESTPPTLTGFPDLADLTSAIATGEIHSLLILGGNPAYNSPGDLAFGAALKDIDFTACLASHSNETSNLCQWQIPQAHPLECWGDLRSWDGTPSVCQPLIEPLFIGRSAIEILAGNGLDAVRQTWRELSQTADFEVFWKTTLHDGLAESLAPIPGIPLLENAIVLTSPPSDIELVIRPDASVGGGESANNGWLQELPRPFTKLVWDNAALIAPAMAKRLALENGDVIRISRGRKSVEGPVWILPGQADGVVTLHLGYGRRSGGSLAKGVGFDVYPLLGTTGETTIRKTGRKHELVTTQHHSVMEGRELIWRVTADDLASGLLPDRPPKVPEVTLYPQPEEMLKGRHAWAMSIDLAACIACNACVTACQAENNIPVVGKEEVRRGREMHWIRLDRYFIGDDPDEPEIAHQPVACHHCEQAPCEVVCPVEATVHTADGLNAMVYNRCVGTRYCSNNCPYKVRRFNFFDYRIKGGKSDPRSLQANPEVTVRGRGVMEKCTYCVQRIERSVVAADRVGRRVRDGEILTACQQACPAQAIVFGDLRDETSHVRQLRGDPRSYSLLGELNTRPRTTYLAEIKNRHV